MPKGFVLLWSVVVQQGQQIFPPDIGNPYRPHAVQVKALLPSSVVPPGTKKKKNASKIASHEECSRASMGQCFVLFDIQFRPCVFFLHVYFFFHIVVLQIIPGTMLAVISIVERRHVDRVPDVALGEVLKAHRAW